MANVAKRADSLHITTIVVVHDGQVWLSEVVASLASQTRRIDNTIVVDTGSIDESIKLLRNARVPLLTLPRDTGFGEAIDAALGKIPPSTGDNEWLWFIHDDCAPQPQALEALVEAVQNRPQVAIAGPKIRGWYDRSHLLELGISIAGNGARWTGLESREYDQGQHDGVHEVLSVSTAGMLVRRNIFEELGGFDKNLALFRDDVDLGWRVRVAGHSVIAVTDAVLFHAQAAASERRSIDVSEAPLHRGLLLDRRNAAYVLLANSTWWLLPWLAIQLVGSSLVRAIGYLLAKLPGYASDEVLAIGLLIFRPGLIRRARKVRKSHRLVSSRVVTTFIPPRWSQIAAASARIAEQIHERFLPASSDALEIVVQLEEEEDLLTPAPPTHWRNIFRRPEVVGVLFLIAFCLVWSRYRFGSLSGGALSTTPSGAIDLWRQYADSWHDVGMGSSMATPTWIAIMAAFSTLALGKASFLVTVLFIFAPLLLMWSMYWLLRQLATNSWLIVGASVGYALSPVALAGINSGRLGTIAAMIITPQIVRFIPLLGSIKKLPWQFIFGLSFLLGLLTAFSLPAYLGIFFFLLVGAARDYIRTLRGTGEKTFMTQEMARWATLIITPFALCFPWSMQALRYPWQFLLEPGLSFAGGGSHLAILANPGGAGAPPWWLISPVTLVLVVVAFSSGKARPYAETGLLFLAFATVASSFILPSHANATSTRAWMGSWIVFATIASLCAGVIILDKLRERLSKSHFHYRHILAALIVAFTLVYTVAATGWAVSVGSNSPLKANQEAILPPFLTLSPGVKILVLRTSQSSGTSALTYFIARERDAFLGDADVAPKISDVLNSTVRDMVDGSGLAASKVFAANGIQYLFMKNPVDKQIVRVIDGLGGFTRNSSTQAGIIWRVSGVSDRLFFTDSSGNSSPLASAGVGARTMAPSAGIISLAENFDSSWQIIKNGTRLVHTRSEYGLSKFQSLESGEFSLIHDGTTRRGWLALQMIVLLVTLVMALPAGRRKKEISVEELT